MQTTHDSKPKIRHRSFTYRSNLSWTGQRSGLLTSDEKEILSISSPPEFHGSRGLWTPEDLFVASVEACTMLTFEALANQKKLRIVSYKSTAVGVLEFVDEDYKFTRIIVRPLIQVSEPEDVDIAKKVLDAAHEHCIISNSMRTEVTIEPKIEVTDLEWALL